MQRSDLRVDCMYLRASREMKRPSVARGLDKIEEAVN